MSSELHAIVLGGVLGAAIGVMDAAWRWHTRSDGCLERSQGEARIDAPADRIAHHAPRPGIEDRREIDEARGYGDVGDVSHPELVRPAGCHVLGEVREDRAIVVAVGRDDKTPAGPHGKPVFFHQSHDLFVIDDTALGPQLDSDAPVAVGRPLGTDLLDAFDEPRLLNQLALGLVIVRRSRETHQPASFLDAEAGGPATTDVVALLGWAAAREAPFRNSFSSVSLPTSRSRAAILASCACMRSTTTVSSSKPPAS